VVVVESEEFAGG